MVVRCIDGLLMWCSPRMQETRVQFPIEAYNFFDPPSCEGFSKELRSNDIFTPEAVPKKQQHWSLDHIRGCD